MEYLIFLNKFEFDNKIFIDKLKTYCNILDYNFEKNKLLIETENFNEEVLKMHEISKVIQLKTKWKKLNFKNLKQDSLNAVTKFNTYIIETEFQNKIPISAKSIYHHVNPYLKHENKIVDEENYECILYIEFKKEDKDVYYKVGISEHKMWNKIKPVDLKFNDIYIVLEEPRLVEEISDFLRLCWIFKTTLYIMTRNNNRIESLLKKAKEITKGIDYEKFNLKFIPHLSKDFIKVGFSKHSDKNESDLINFFKENEDEKICLVFGNDTYGLT